MFFVDLMYMFDMYSISSSTCIPVSLLDYSSVHYMISCYYIIYIYIYKRRQEHKIWAIGDFN